MWQTTRTTPCTCKLILTTSVHNGYIDCERLQWQPSAGRNVQRSAKAFILKVLGRAAKQSLKKCRDAPLRKSGRHVAHCRLPRLYACLLSVYPGGTFPSLRLSVAVCDGLCLISLLVCMRACPPVSPVSCVSQLSYISCVRNYFPPYPIRHPFLIILDVYELMD